MTINELKERRNLLKEELSTIVTTAEKETRKLNEKEDGRMNEIKEEIEKVDGEIRAIEDENKKLQLEADKNKSIKTERKMTLINKINQIVNNRSLDEASMAEVEAARAEFRKSAITS